MSQKKNVGGHIDSRVRTWVPVVHGVAQDFNVAITADLSSLRLHGVWKSWIQSHTTVKSIVDLEMHVVVNH